MNCSSTFALLAEFAVDCNIYSLINRDESMNGVFGPIIFCDVSLVFSCQIGVGSFVVNIIHSRHGDIDFPIVHR